MGDQQHSYSLKVFIVFVALGLPFPQVHLSGGGGGGGGGQQASLLVRAGYSRGTLGGLTPNSKYRNCWLIRHIPSSSHLSQELVGASPRGELLLPAYRARGLQAYPAQCGVYHHMAMKINEHGKEVLLLEKGALGQYLIVKGTPEKMLNHLLHGVGDGERIAGRFVCCVYVCLSFVLCLFVCVCISVFCLHICLHLKVCLQFVFVHLNLSAFKLSCLFVYLLFVCLFVCPFKSLSVCCLNVCLCTEKLLFLCLSVEQFVFCLCLFVCIEKLLYVCLSAH